MVTQDISIGSKVRKILKDDIFVNVGDTGVIKKFNSKDVVLVAWDGDFKTKLLTHCSVSTLAVTP